MTYMYVYMFSSIYLIYTGKEKFELHLGYFQL